MKKFTMILATVLVAFTMQSCITAALNSAKKVAKEAEAILSGDVFEIEQATVTYDNGITLAFKDYGRYQYIKDAKGGETTIITPKKTISLDDVNKTYAIQEIDREGMFASEYVFMEVALSVIDKYDVYSENKLESSKMEICGKTCNAYTDEDGTVMAGWKRILLYEKGSEIMKAVTLVEKVDKMIFEIPAGYKNLYED